MAQQKPLPGACAGCGQSIRPGHVRSHAASGVRPGRSQPGRVPNISCMCSCIPKRQSVLQLYYSTFLKSHQSPPGCASKTKTGVRQSESACACPGHRGAFVPAGALQRGRHLRARGARGGRGRAQGALHRHAHRAQGGVRSRPGHASAQAQQPLPSLQPFAQAMLIGGSSCWAMQNLTQLDNLEGSIALLTDC